MYEDLDPTSLYPPVPAPDELTRFFWEGVNEHQLRILRCDDCGFYVHWPRQVCRNCLSTSLAPADVSGDATLVTWTFPAQPFDPWFRSHLPYCLAVVELPEQAGLRLVTDLVDYEKDDLRIDLPLRVVFREVAPNLTLPLFTPVA